jgi:hypothetical protein
VLSPPLGVLQPNPAEQQHDPPGSQQDETVDGSIMPLHDIWCSKSTAEHSLLASGSTGNIAWQ